jgi:hypothetical protein
MTLTVIDEHGLDTFRTTWSGTRLLELLHEQSGRLLVTWPIGVGKSVALDSVIEAAVRRGAYDLIIALVPTRRVLDERRWIREPPPGLKVVNLLPRPRQQCGPLDETWRQFEQAGLGALGRRLLCASCPHFHGCFWPGQYGQGLSGASVIFGTQTHLERDPGFITRLADWAGAVLRRALVVLDEDNLILTSYRRFVSRADLEMFVTILDQVRGLGGGSALRRWHYQARLMLIASTADLRCPEWLLPPLSLDTTISIQQAGWARFGPKFRFLANDLGLFGRSPTESRERTDSGDLLFAAPPRVPGHFIIFSGTARPEFIRFRLGVEAANPFAGHRFMHSGTRWYNIASRTGMRSHFPGNANQVLDLFAGLVASRIGQGQRPLLVAKKMFVRLCARAMMERLAGLGLQDVRIVTDNWEEANLESPGTVPLISYGVIGTNLFEEFTCAFCLTGYCIDEKVIDHVLQDILASDGHLPIRITTVGRPRRRRAGVVWPAHKGYDLNRLAQLALEQQELDKVLQAVGRVRPYTRPREIVTFMCSAHPQLAYTREFDSIGEAREFFGVPSCRQRRKRDIAERVQAARRAGRTQTQAAAELGLGLATVKRYWGTDAGTPA